MTVAASGKYALRLDDVRNLIAESAAFQTWTGTANTAAAKLRTHLGWYTTPATYPLALVDHIGHEAEKDASGGVFDVPDYRIYVLFETQAPTASVDNYSDEINSFLNTISSIEDQFLSALNDGSGRPSIEGFSGPEFGWPDRDRRQSGERLYSAEYEFILRGHT